MTQHTHLNGIIIYVQILLYVVPTAYNSFYASMYLIINLKCIQNIKDEAENGEF